MNLVKTSQLPLVEFLRYVQEGNEHHEYIMERKKSNCERIDNWVTAISKRPATFYVQNKLDYLEADKNTTTSVN